MTIDELDNPVPGRSKIVQTSGLDGKTELEPIVDADIAKFDVFYQRALSNTKLTNYERAAIKTYLHWKLLPPQ